MEFGVSRRIKPKIICAHFNEGKKKLFNVWN